MRGLTIEMRVVPERRGTDWSTMSWRGYEYVSLGLFLRLTIPFYDAILYEFMAYMFRLLRGVNLDIRRLGHTPRDWNGL